MLYDRYGIGKDRTTGKFLVYEKGSNITFDFESDLANKVKFAHTWVTATKYGQPTTSPQLSETEITPEEYERAFNENSRMTYEAIMRNSMMGLRNFETMPTVEQQKQVIKSAVPYKWASAIVEGLYSTENGYASFENWCVNATRIQLEQIEKMQQEQSGKQR